MIWRTTVSTQEFMKNEMQAMTTKFSVRPSIPTKSPHAQSASSAAPSPEADSLPLPPAGTATSSSSGASTASNSTASSPTSTMIASMPGPIGAAGSTSSSAASSGQGNQVLYLNFSSKAPSSGQQASSSSPASSNGSPHRKAASATNRGTKASKKSAYRVNGVNILNRKDVDSRTVVERIQRRREYHNYVERRRRDTINNTILALSEVVPDAIQPGQKPHKGKILKATLDYIMQLQAENDAFRQQFGDGCLHVSPGPGAMLVEPQSPPVMPLSAMPAPPPPQAMMGMPNAAASASSSRSSTPTPVMSPAPPALAPMAPIAPNVALDARPALPALAPRPPVCPPLMWDAEKRCRNTCHY